MVACVGCVARDRLDADLARDTRMPGGMLVVDPLTQLVKIALLVLTIFTVLLSMESNFTTHAGEYLALILLATVGMMFLVSSEDILMIFCLARTDESLALHPYCVQQTRTSNPPRRRLKYFLFGGMSAAFTLFGLSLFTDCRARRTLREIAAALAGKGLDPLLVVAIVMAVIGFRVQSRSGTVSFVGAGRISRCAESERRIHRFRFKGRELFHLCQGDDAGVRGSRRERSVAGVCAWLGTGDRCSSCRFRCCWVIWPRSCKAASGVCWHIRQSRMRVTCCSASCPTPRRAPHRWFTMWSRTGLTTVGAFGVVGVVETRDWRMTNSRTFAGLSRRAPLVSFCMLIFMLSLAGIPPLAGFFGKFYVFTAAVQTGAPGLGLLWLVFIAIAMSAVSLYYYLQVLKRIYVADSPVEAGALKVPIVSQIAICLLAAAVLLLGCTPGLLLTPLDGAIKLAGF